MFLLNIYVNTAQLYLMFRHHTQCRNVKISWHIFYNCLSNFMWGEQDHTWSLLALTTSWFTMTQLFSALQSESLNKLTNEQPNIYVIRCYAVLFISVQHECIPQAVLGMDILCQAKSGMGKTAVFVLATLQQLEPTENQVYVLVMCHTRELAFQISKEYERFSKYMPQTKVCLSY